MTLIHSTAKATDSNLIVPVLRAHLSAIQDKEDLLILNEVLQQMENGGMPQWWTSQEFAYLNTHDRETWAKYVIFRYKFRVYPEKKIVPAFPTYVLIEPVSSCNLRCPMCFQVDKSFTRKPYMGVMNFNLFKQIIDEIEKEGPGAITLASRGEPTLHPQFAKMLEYMSGKIYEVKINTNATKLTDALCHAILQHGVDDLVFSVDSHLKEQYEKIRVNAIFSNVLGNIKRFSSIREKYYKGSKTRTLISAVKIRDTQDFNGFTEFWSKYVDDITIFEMEERWDTYNNAVHPDVKVPCNYIWERFYIWYDGTCNPCDVDYKSQLSPGKITDTTTIKDIWQGSALNKLRNAHLEGRRSDLVPCDRCGICSFEV